MPRGCFRLSTKSPGCIEGPQPFDCNPQAAACTSPRSNRMLLPISISGRKMSVSKGNAILQEIDVPSKDCFSWLSMAACRLCRHAETPPQEGAFHCGTATQPIGFVNDYNLREYLFMESRGLRRHAKSQKPVPVSASYFRLTAPPMTGLSSISAVYRTVIDRIWPAAIQCREPSL